MKQIVLETGFVFDYENLYGDGLITSEDMKSLEPDLQRAMTAATQVRKTGIVEGHLSKDGEPELVLFPQLPYVEEGNINSPWVMAKLEELRAHAQADIDLVISFGIGGSYLGNKVIFDVHCGEFWNHLSDEERLHYPKLLFSGNNVDAARTRSLIDFVRSEAKGRESYKVLLMVISKSGSTIEPMSNFMIVEEALRESGIAYEVIAVTDPHSGEKETLLHALAREEKWDIFSVPDGVGGRFSVFTEVGLVVAAVIGFDIRQFLEGAKAMDQACRHEDVWENPALLNATLKYIGAHKYGRHIEVFMPYADDLKSMAEWYIQLLAESTGKKVNRDGEAVLYGRTPVVAVGTTDMHAQTQEHQEGPQDKIVQFLQVQDRGVSLAVPHTYDRYAKLAAFSGLELQDILQAALAANADALAGDNRFNSTFILPTLNAFHLGELMFMLCWSIFFEGELARIDAFNQPGVEVYKRLLGPKLAALKGEQ